MTVYENIFLSGTVDDRFFLWCVYLADPGEAELSFCVCKRIAEFPNSFIHIGYSCDRREWWMNGSLPLPIAQNTMLSTSSNTPTAIFVSEKEAMIKWTMAAMPPIAIGTAAIRKIKDINHWKRSVTATEKADAEEKRRNTQNDPEKNIHLLRQHEYQSVGSQKAQDVYR